MKIKKGSTVKIIAGNDKGKKGQVLAVYTKSNKILVEGVNLKSKFVKSDAQNNLKGGIIKVERVIDASNAKATKEVAKSSSEVKSIATKKKSK
jgi:large subunit ribosomal protein L24